MSAREITLVDTETGRWASVIKPGWSWVVICTDSPDDYQCQAKIVGFGSRTQAIHGAESHLRWHSNGMPSCRDCGAWLTRKGSTRCRKGTCAEDY